MVFLKPGPLASFQKVERRNKVSGKQNGQGQEGKEENKQGKGKSGNHNSGYKTWYRKLKTNGGRNNSNNGGNKQEIKEHKEAKLQERIVVHKLNQEVLEAEELKKNGERQSSSCAFGNKSGSNGNEVKHVYRKKANGTGEGKSTRVETNRNETKNSFSALNREELEILLKQDAPVKSNPSLKDTSQPKPITVP